MSLKKLILMLTASAVSVCAVAAQDKTEDQSKTTIKHVPMTTVSPVSGKEMYTAYCAVCHGTEGKGNGPAATALKATPADLSLLSKENGGKYPALKVTSAIRGTGDVAAHGSRDMPVWGELFWTMSRGHEGEVQQRVSNLTHYIETLQEK
jgi:mono/diheme cytochrome c family protein